jgi:SNF2 family DNA or RNA helicase
MLKSFAHQERALERFKDVPSFALWWDMGTGKTKPVLEIADHRLKNGVINKVLVITPLAVVPHWREEIELFVPHLTFITATGNTTSKKFAFGRPRHIYVTNYETLTYTDDYIIEFVDDKTMLVFDESTKVKRYGARRSKTACLLADKTRHIALLTGTPITNTLLDVWTQAYLLDRGATFTDKYFYFRRLYFRAVDRDKHIWIPYKETEEKIRSAVYALGSIEHKEDCLDLPPKVYIKTDVPMNDYTRGIYEQFKKDLLLKFGDQEVKGSTVLTEIIKLHEIVNGFVISTEGKTIDLANSKIEYICELLQDELYGKQVVIWCPYRYAIKRLFEAISKTVPNSVVQTLYGDTDEVVRETIEKDFRAGKILILIANQEVGGYGINLTPCSNVIYFTNNYRVETRLQSEDRVHRPGATAEKVTIIDLVVSGTVDEAIFKLLMRKVDMSRSITKIRDLVEGNVADTQSVRSVLPTSDIVKDSNQLPPMSAFDSLDSRRCGGDTSGNKEIS